MAWAVAVLAIVLTVGVVLAIYAISYRMLVDEDVTGHRELAGSVVFRISALHGLILSLVFAQLTFDYQELRRESADETAALADIYFDIARYDGGHEDAGQAVIRDYVRTVIDEEWQSLARTGRLSGEAWIAWERVYDEILDLEPSSRREAALHDHMLEQIHAIAGFRDARAAHRLAGLDELFWVPAIAGVLLVAASFHTFPPNRHTFFMLSLYGAFTGLVLYIIYALSNPFDDPGAMRPEAFNRLLAVDFAD